jgi:predicted membrane protein (TIGR00267 family)
MDEHHQKNNFQFKEDDKIPEPHLKSGKYIRDVVFGANDGLVSILALVAGVAGGITNNKIILLAGIAGTIAGAISMALGAYISTKSHREYVQSEIKRERWEIDNVPEKEKKELYDFYSKKGFKGKDLDRVVEVISSNKEIMLDVMIRDELGLDTEPNNPLIAGILAGIAFLIGSLPPIIPFLFETSNALLIAIIGSLIGLFILGALKTIITKKNPLMLGLESIIVGGVAMAITYYVGTLFGVAGV